MDSSRSRPVVDRVDATHLGYLGAGLAYLVAILHLFHPRRGFPRLVTVLQTGDPSLLAYDPRPLLFVLSGFALVVGVKLVILGLPRRHVYALGAALVSIHVAGYFAWHLTGHGGILPGREPHYHGLHAVEAVLVHLAEYPLARTSKLAELALLAVLVVLYRHESR